MLLLETAHVYASSTSPPATRTKCFANILAKIYNSLFSRVIGQELSIQSPLTESFQISVTTPQRTDLGIHSFSSQFVYSVGAQTYLAYSYI